MQRAGYCAPYLYQLHVTRRGKRQITWFFYLEYRLLVTQKKMQAGKSDFVLFSLWSQSINKKWISSTRVYLLNSVETKSNGLPSCLSVVSSSSEKRLALSTVEDWMPLSRFRGQHSLHSLERNVLVSIVYSTGLIAANRGIVTSCTMILLRSSSFLYKTGEQSFALHCWLVPNRWRWSTRWSSDEYQGRTWTDWSWSLLWRARDCSTAVQQ